MERWAPEPLPMIVLDLEDSGIDSDSDQRGRQNPMVEYGLLDLHISERSEEGSSDEEFSRTLNKERDPSWLHSSSEDLSPNRHQDQPKRPKKPVLNDNNDPGRDSPPLLEVELTASDEDDDGSVLELVIPIQKKTKYQRVPSNNDESEVCLVFKFLCCFPKK